MNAKNTNLDDCTLYVSLFPCNECAKLIIQSGIKKVIYFDDKYACTEHTQASKIMLQKAGVECTEFKKRDKKVIINL